MKVIIIGGVAGGASTAARLRRNDENAEIIMYEKSGHVSYANCGLPYYIGDVITDRNKLLLQTPESFKQRFNVDVKVNHEVVEIKTKEKQVVVKNLVSGETFSNNYDKLVLSPGAKPFLPPWKNADLDNIFTLRNVVDMDKIKNFIKTNTTKTAVVIGAGFIGLEMAENLHHAGVKTTIVEMANQILPPMDLSMAAMLQQHIRTKGVTLMLSKAVIGFEKKANGIEVIFSDNTTLQADIVIASVGVRPDIELATKAEIKTGATKAILINDFMLTSDENIYALGDAIEFANPQSGKPFITLLAGPANKQARIVADNIAFSNKYKYKGAINTAIVKVFDMTAAITGLSIKILQKENIPFICSVTHSGSHAGYYPGSNQSAIQIAFSPKDGKLLGAQIVGGDGVDKRIDVFSSMIQQGNTVYDLMEFEHAYAPPFSSAKDPVNMAGFVADNILSNKVKILEWHSLEQADKDAIWLDVRTPKEFSEGTIPNAINIPVDDLRERIKEIPKDKKVYVFCKVGLRGYIAYRILAQKGYTNISNFTGGYLLWDALQKEYRISNKEF